MNFQSSGYREYEHTADWELKVWAPDLNALMEQAAHGMYSLSGVRLESGPRLVRSLEFSAEEPESMLVTFLEELLYLGEVEGLGFDTFELDVSSGTLQAELHGAPIASLEKEIKAVTYHKLEIRTNTDRGLEVNIVFDV